MNGRQTYEEIVRKADAEIAKFEGMIQRANEEFDAIAARGAGQLSPADQARLTQLNQDRKAITASMRRVALVTLEKLDKTDELKALAASIRAVRADLEKRRARIVRFASTAEEFGETSRQRRRSGDSNRRDQGGHLAPR